MKLVKKTDTEVTDVVTRPTEGEDFVETDSRKYSRWGWIIVLLGVGGFLLWASLAPLDRGVPVNGYLAVASNRKAIQHLSGGTVDEILVKDGDRVKAGQVLIRMNSVQSRSNAEITRGQYLATLAVEARLVAERDGAASLTFPQTLKDAANDPRAAESMALQSQLFTTRRAALRDELAAIEQNIAGLEAQVAGTRESQKAKRDQAATLKEQLVGLRDLAKDGYIARNRLLEVERTASQVAGAIAEDAGSLGRMTRQIAELKLRLNVRRQEYQREVRTQLTEVQKEAEAMSSRLTSQDFELANVEVKSPVDGVVLGLAVFTRGAVVGPGTRLMDVVPGDDPLVVEGMVPVHLIDKVHAELPVEMMFSAFNTNTTPHIPGVVDKVAPDRSVDEHTGQPYYKMQAKITPAGMKEIQRLRLQLRPGMPVDLFVKTGERTLMSYMFRPLIDRMKSSMTEE